MDQREEVSRVDRQRNVLWENARARARRRAEPRPEPARRLSSAEVAEQRAQHAEALGLPQSAAAIRQLVDEVPELYPRREKQQP